MVSYQTGRGRFPAAHSAAVGRRRAARKLGRLLDEWTEAGFLLTSDLAAAPYTEPLAPGGALGHLGETRTTYHALREQLEDSLQGLRGLAVRLSAGAPDEEVAAAGGRWLRPRRRPPGAPDDVPGGGRVLRERPGGPSGGPGGAAHVERSHDA
jgi:hypothetical protein